MKHCMLGLLAETFVHPGAGQAGGAVDLPVAREAATDYPYIPGSSLKGALRDTLTTQHRETEHEIFGQQDNAGSILVSDARLLLLPVRSLTSHYRWVTSPHLLERLTRDRKRSGRSALPETPLQVGENNYLGEGPHILYLEERSFTKTAGDDRLTKYLEALEELMGDASARGRLARQLVVLDDHDFSWFVRYGLAIQARNVLDEQKKTSKNLWYEETLPPDTLMYAVLSERGNKPGVIQKVKARFDDRNYLQVGGNETVGQGWFQLTWKEADE